MQIADLVMVAAVSAGLFVSACGGRQVYETGQLWQRNQCLKILDQVARERCVSESTHSYEDYKRETNRAPKD